MSIERRLINTGYYPRLALGLNQHFASKGGYIVHFAPPEGRNWSPTATGSLPERRRQPYARAPLPARVPERGWDPWRPAVHGLFCHALEAAESPSADIGESIYRRGVLASGAPLRGTRQVGSLGLVGAEAACINCHRRSGLGSREGTLTIPPITGEYLFRARGTAAQEPMLHGYGNRLGHRDPYTDATLARAIREGMDSTGRQLRPLMPRFALDDASMGALLDYLKKLGTRRMRGVTDTVLHFATVITPDADPVKRQGMLDVLKMYFIEKNSSTVRTPHAAAQGGQDCLWHERVPGTAPLAVASLGTHRSAGRLA